MKICSKPMMIAYVMGSLITALLSIGFAFILSSIINLISKNDINLLVNCVVFFCVYCIVAVSCSHLLCIWRNRIIKAHLKTLKMQLFESYLGLSHQDFQNESIGGILNQLTSNITQYKRLYLESILGLPAMIISLCLAVLSTFYIDYRLLIIMIIFGILMFFLTKYTSTKMNNDTAHMIKCNESHMKISKDLLSGHFLIQSSNLFGHAIKRFRNNTEETLQASYNQSNTMLFVANAASLLGMLSTVIIMGVSAIFAIKGIISIGMVLALSNLMGKIINPISSIGQIFNNLKAGTQIKNSFINQLNKSSVANSSKLPINDIEKIDVRNLYFSYDKSIFNNFSCSFQTQKKYAVVGPVGCGKSTLLKLISGMIDTSHIYYNNTAQVNLSKANLLKQIAYVPQTIYFFEDTILNNITLFQDINQLEVVKVIDDLGLKDVLDKLPDGLETILSENGQILSGGERQKLALARALLTNKPILLLDEYTSNMDPKSSHEIQKYVSSLNKTVIFITHKINDYDVQHADDIIYV